MASLVWMAHVACACGDEPAPMPIVPIYPADYALTYQEARSCRDSIEHDVIRVRVLVAPDAVRPYNMRDVPFPAGTILLKQQFDTGDVDCTGPLRGITAMQKLAAGEAPDELDWRWQEVDDKGDGIATAVGDCVDCHRDCGTTDPGYDSSCGDP